MTTSTSYKNKNISATEDALVDASKLLSRLCKSRKAAMRLQEIINLTGKVASLSRSLQSQDSDHDGPDGYGDPNHYSKISEVKRKTHLVR
ncbi:hypothetical protein [Desulfuromonas soudanensis]|uniref:hypothetical protein n=1 Tax=Desulfuromonas soudanensis TaxID=1603606 RepID=UPI0012F96A75|nr:hypothetical protein [Desulfuromonas soudanensis]